MMQHNGYMPLPIQESHQLAKKTGHLTPAATATASAAAAVAAALRRAMGGP